MIYIIYMQCIYTSMQVYVHMKNIAANDTLSNLCQHLTCTSCTSSKKLC